MVLKSDYDYDKQKADDKVRKLSKNVNDDIYGNSDKSIRRKLQWHYKLPKRLALIKTFQNTSLKLTRKKNLSMNRKVENKIKIFGWLWKNVHSIEKQMRLFMLVIWEEKWVKKALRGEIFLLLT